MNSMMEAMMMDTAAAMKLVAQLTETHSNQCFTLMTSTNMMMSQFMEMIKAQQPNRMEQQIGKIPHQSL